MPPTRQISAVPPPCCAARPTSALLSATVEASDRSIPATAITNVVPVASTIGMDASASTPLMFAMLRKPGAIAQNTTIRTASPPGAVHCSQKSGCRCRRTSRLSGRLVPCPAGSSDPPACSAVTGSRFAGAMAAARGSRAPGNEIRLLTERVTDRE